MATVSRSIRRLATASALAALTAGLPATVSAQYELRREQNDPAQQQRSEQGAAARQEQRQGATQPKGQSEEQAQGQPQGGTQAQQADQAFIVLVPHVVVTDTDLGDGCWARLYDEQNYRGEMLSVVGPVALRDMSTRFGEFGRRYDSVVVGPKARVTVYDNENFQQRTARFRAGQQVPDLDEKLGFFENIRSMRVDCTS